MSGRSWWTLLQLVGGILALAAWAMLSLEHDHNKVNMRWPSDPVHCVAR